MPEPRLATAEDLEHLIELEHLCFDAARQASRASLRRSILSPSQEVWMMEDDFGVLAAMVLWPRAKSLRVYGVAVRPDAQGRGLGAQMLRFAEARAPGKVILEADALDRRLLSWYTHRGYRPAGERPDFYGVGRPAVRMVKDLR